MVVEVEFDDDIFDDTQVANIIHAAIKAGYIEARVLSMAKYSMPNLVHVKVQPHEEDN